MAGGDVGECGTEQVQGIFHSRASQDKDGSAGGTAANKAPHLLQSLGAVTFGSTAQAVCCTASVVSRESKASVKAQRGRCGLAWAVKMGRRTASCDGAAPKSGWPLVVGR